MRPDELERRLPDNVWTRSAPRPRAELLYVLVLPDFERAERRTFQALLTGRGGRPPAAPLCIRLKPR